MNTEQKRLIKEIANTLNHNEYIIEMFIMVHNYEEWLNEDLYTRIMGHYQKLEMYIKSNYEISNKFSESKDEDFMKLFHRSYLKRKKLIDYVEELKLPKKC